MTPVTIYLTQKPAWPLRGVREDDGTLRVGAIGGWEFSRPMQPAEIFKVEEVETPKPAAQ